MKQQTFKPQPVKRLGARMGYTLIEFLVGIVTIVGFMYKFERDTRRDIEELRIGLTNVQRDVGELRRVMNGLGDFLSSLVENLGRKRIIEDVDLLKTALRNMTTTTTNPLTEEERKRLLELIDKGEDMTPEEADELARLARKFYREYAGKVENAWLMLYYAGAIRGIVYGKYNRKLTPILD